MRCGHIFFPYTPSGKAVPMKQVSPPSMKMFFPPARKLPAPSFKSEGRRQEAEGSYVDVTVYTRMECLLPCLAYDGSKPTDSFVTKNKICCETRSEPALQEGLPP